MEPRVADAPASEWDDLDIGLTPRDAEIAGPPSRQESRFRLAAGLLPPARDRLPEKNMRVRRLRSDDGIALVGRVLDAEQARAVRQSFGLGGGPAMTGATAFEAAMGRGDALPLAKGRRLARRRLIGADRIEIEGPADADTAALKRMGCTVEIVSFRAWIFAPNAETMQRILDRRPLAARAARAMHMAGPTPAVSSIAGAPWSVPPARRPPFPFPRTRSTAMPAQTLPDEPDFRFAPACDVETDAQRIRIVIEGLAGRVPTALIALNPDDALSICGELDRRPGYDREARTAMAARSMQAEGDDPESDPRY